MTSSRRMLRMVGGLFTIIGLTTPTLANEDKGKGKKGEPKSQVIEIDVSKLSPEVARFVLDLAKTAKPDAPTYRAAPEPKKEESTPKLPPGLAKKMKESPTTSESLSVPPKPAVSEKKPLGKAEKPVSLTEAVAIAEKLGNGVATKVERKGEGEELHYKIDLLGSDGHKQKIELSATGKPIPKKND